MGVDFPVVQIVGYQNSGKTTAAQRLIKSAVKAGFRLGTIKHHGHGGEPDGTLSSKDSHKHMQAGAALSAVEGDGVLQLANQKGQWTLEELTAIYKALRADGILIEGYKKAHYPKIVMLGKQEDASLLKDLTNIVLILREKTVEIEDLSIPVFLRDEHEKYCGWFVDFLRGKIYV
ncbi:molybdopterin-guanine dinucleotide biosynthesis protein B [Jeotgalibacillus proteolyticus]|uniref:molybdopterin-guanine dinucleotide biosynthesis protein B n=1 Tax=Jeotgalibacillus proteolyticus TaxID=2082395 RepID=UPI003CE72C9E